MINLELTKEEAELLSLCIESGLAIYRNQKAIEKYCPRLVQHQDKKFLRAFKVRKAKSLLNTLNEKRMKED